MTSRLSPAARAAIESSRDEAVRRGDRRIGTDHLLLGILHDTDIATLTGVDVLTARTHAHDLDRRALAAIGITAPEIDPMSRAHKSKHMPLSSGVRAVIPRALAMATARKARQATTIDLLDALLERKQPDPAAVLLNDLHIKPGSFHANQ
ncbi:Clp protease N-terminal domain-containing protein [Arthrobacter dokdonensis]|uniref:Clp protease N-terminal domain-containing protein n=1 Tax=Arthrobacter dokdonellae TaxID=2211210 RepID=UPI0014943A3F|nr:Clp protease N-terminal domain-containing protein [Arthrobacter dokdonellae]